MTDLFDASEDLALDVDGGPADGGQAEVDGAAEREYLPVDELGDRFVRVKVDGEEIAVPLAEAINGYQRQADYTRKTQELAQMREQLSYAQTLAQALEANPQATLRLLQETYGVAEGNAMANAAMAEARGLDDDDDDVWVDPLEERLSNVERMFQQLERERIAQQLQGEIQHLQQKYGEDFNPREVIISALQQRRHDLENVYKEIAFDRLQARLSGVSDFAAAEQHKEQERLSAKSSLDVEVGSSGSTSAAVPQGNPSSVAEAWAMAKHQLGIKSI